MSIVVRKKFDIQDKDLSPKLMNIEDLKDKSDELDYLKNQLEELKDVKEKNIKLALQIKDLRNKSNEYKNQYNKVNKELIERHKINKSLNIIILCPKLEKPITFYQCNDACKLKLCELLYDCNIRIETIKNAFNIP